MTDVEAPVPSDIPEKLLIEEIVVTTLQKSDELLEITTSDDNKIPAEQNSDVQTNLIDNIPNDDADEINISQKSNSNLSEVNVSQINIKSNKKRLNLIDSDSENDEIHETSKMDNASVNKKRFTLLDSDSEDENSIKTNETKKDDTEVIGRTNKNRMALIDSDSDDENLITNEMKKGDTEKTNEDRMDLINENTDENQIKKKSRLLQICDSDSEDETNQENGPTNITFQTDIDTEQEKTLVRLKDLCDSESSAEEPDDHISKENIIKQKRTKKFNEQKMTGKEALEQRQQILSESQRMVRETRVHLPYHRPKQHTLQEFLNRRSLLNRTIKAPPNTPTGLSIKMLNRNLKTAEQKLKEKEKEIEQFYKSESEEEIEAEPEKNEAEEMNVDQEIQKIVLQVETEKVFEEDATNADKVEEKIQNEEEDKIQNTLGEESITEVIENENQNESLEAQNNKEMETNEEGKTIEDQSEILETHTTNPEQSEEDTLNKITDEDKEAKLKELRLILEKNIFNSASQLPLSIENTESKEESSLNELIELPSSQVEVATQIFNAKEEKKKKLAEIEIKLKQLNPLVALKGNLQPRLSGGPNELIVFDDDIQRSKRVNSLMQRFLNHTTVKPTQKKSGFNILKVEGANITTETINLTEDTEEDLAKENQTPGLRKKKLKTDIEEQIMKQRLEELKKKQEEMRIDNEEDDAFIEEKELCGKILDNEEEEELTDPSSSSEEEEEDDFEIQEKPRMKSAFVDEEAEESDDQENVEDNEESESESEDPEDQEANKKPLRRIITPADDSDDDTTSMPESGNGTEKINAGISAELFPPQTPLKTTTWEDNEQDNDEFPAYQQPSNGLEKTPCKPITQKNDLTSLLTPTLHLTALQGMNSATKSFHASPNVNQFLPPEPSPLKSHCIKTKLFTDQEDNLDELENLCSGKFTTQAKKDFTTQESELLNICSGDFSECTQSESLTNENLSLLMKPTQSLDLLLKEDSQNYNLTIESETPGDLNNEIKEKTEESTSKSFKMIIASSSEDEDKENSSPKKKKLKKKKKYVIDDISITDEDELEDRSQTDEFEENEEDTEKTKNVDYDSEENEIEYVDFEDKPVKKASDFFENEAELSESDWGSEDEDEKNLDKYEIEEGDQEKINETKVQRELERMHMRNVLDEDQREVKMLQELLLEDGELHGAGRERKFRWKNADSMAWTADSDKTKDDEEDFEEMESELQWRKMRHEREVFLKEQQNKRESQQNEEEDFVNDSQVLKLGLKSLKCSSGSLNSSQKKTPVAETVAKSDDIKLPFSFINKRGSFLQRSEMTLLRLAEITKATATINGPKNSKNFVFTSVEKTDLEIGVEEETNLNIKKRKAEDGTPKALKKLRIADMSPNVPKRKKKLNLT